MPLYNPVLQWATEDHMVEQSGIAVMFGTSFVGEGKTLSYSIFKDIITIGDKPSKRTICGHVIFKTVETESLLAELNYPLAFSDASCDTLEPPDEREDLVPTLDIVMDLSKTGECQNAVFWGRETFTQKYAMLRGVELLRDNYGVAIDDLVPEVPYSFIAKEIIQSSSMDGLFAVLREKQNMIETYTKRG